MDTQGAITFALVGFIATLVITLWAASRAASNEGRENLGPAAPALVIPVAFAEPSAVFVTGNVSHNFLFTLAVWILVTLVLGRMGYKSQTT